MILLDTHVVLWLGLEPNRISRKARAAIERARASDQGLAISAVTLLELAQISIKKRIDVGADIEEFLSKVERIFVVFPITGRICLQTLSLPASYPKDPFDRVIGATALIEDIPLLTADRAVQDSQAVPFIW